MYRASAPPDRAALGRAPQRDEALRPSLFGKSSYRRLPPVSCPVGSIRGGTACDTGNQSPSRCPNPLLEPRLQLLRAVSPTMVGPYADWLPRTNSFFRQKRSHTALAVGHRMSQPTRLAARPTTPIMAFVLPQSLPATFSDTPRGHSRAAYFQGKTAENLPPRRSTQILPPVKSMLLRR